MKTLLIALPLLLAVPLGAQARETTPTTKVSYVDLDLRSKAGVTTLDKRLKRAIEATCTQYEGNVTMELRAAVTRCTRAKWKEMAPQRARAIEGSAALASQVARAR